MTKITIACLLIRVAMIILELPMTDPLQLIPGLLSAPIKPLVADHAPVQVLTGAFWINGSLARP